MKAYGGEVEALTSAESAGVGVRVVVDGRQGFAHCGTLDPAAIDEALAEARDNAGFGEVDPWAGLAEPDGVEAVTLQLASPELAGFDPDIVFNNDDYNAMTGGGNGNPTRLRTGDTGRYQSWRTLTAGSARLLTNGQVLIASRTAGNPQPLTGPVALGGEVFTLRITDYPTWRPDLWVQNGAGQAAALAMAAQIRHDHLVARGQHWD